jgi:carbamoyl-phosphate synthase large subunit
MKRILLIGCGGSAGYNFVESLRMADEEFYVVGTDINHEHLELSNCDVKYIVPRNSEPEYPEKINKIIEEENIDFVHMQPDPEVAFWSENRERLDAPFLLPSKDAVRLCHDKMRFNKALAEKGIPVPESHHIGSREDIPAAFESLRKKREKVWIRAIRGAGSKASLPVTELGHVNMWIDYWNKNKGTDYSDFMLAEFLPGKEYAFQSIWKDGKIITSQARERREYVFGNIMPSGQSSSPSVAVTVHNDRVNKTATEAIRAVDERPQGIYCVDLKENSQGEPCVTEINIGRFFTTNDFFSKAGCNMPYYFIQLGLGEDIPELPEYNALEKDLYWLRIIDMGKKLIRGGEWSYKKI